MADDFLKLFYPLCSEEVCEYDLYNIMDDVHALIEAKIYSSVPNAMRKFSDCLLYRCDENLNGYNLMYNDSDLVNFFGSFKKLLLDYTQERQLYFENVKPFLDWANTHSHYTGARFAEPKREDIKKYMRSIIRLWNWYVEKRNLSEEYIIDENDDLTLPGTTEQKAPLINMDELKKDIIGAIIDFKNNIKCPYRTYFALAKFLQGVRIPQTDYASLDKWDLYGKYSKNSFTVEEYDTALMELLREGKIVQYPNNNFFDVVDEKSGIFVKLYAKYLKIFDKYSINRKDYNYVVKINQKYVKLIQKAIDEDKKISLVYQKLDGTKKRRIVTPIKMVPRTVSKEEIFNGKNARKYTGDLYYLGVKDEGDNGAEKTFVLSRISNPKII